MKKLHLLSFAALLAGAAHAQDPATRAEQIQRQRGETFRSPIDDDTDMVEKAIMWANEHRLLEIFNRGFHGLVPTVGGTIAGGGFALGPQFLRTDLLGGRMIFRTSARFSTKFYQLYDLDVGLPRLLHGNVYADFYVRHRNYSQVPYYGPGPGSHKEGRTNYRLEDTQYDFSIGVRPLRWLRIGAVGGYYQPNVGPGTQDGIASTETVYSPAQAPGIDHQKDYLHGGFLTEVDYRDSIDGARSGGRYYARLDYWKDQTGGNGDFRRLTAEAQQFIPLFNKKRVIIARVKTIMSFTPQGNQVPFYLQPSIGGQDDVRGHRMFRFYDNNSIVANAEWRWEVLTGLDGALFFDAGKVEPRPGMLNFKRLATSFGGGFRVRAPGSEAVAGRLDIGVSRDGVRVWLTFHDLFAAPQVRTGRELSPPPGRLP